jgi:hypothetical protein
MQGSAAPGVYFEPLQPSQLIGDLLRSDIAGFIGYASKGPVALPVRIESWRQYLSIFGDPIEIGHLAPAIKGFFENGGGTCYVLRIVDGNALEASRLLEANRLGSDDVPDKLWRMNASFRVSDIVTSEEVVNQVPDSAILQNFRPGEVNLPLPNPGFWGNALNVSISRSSLLCTQIKRNGIFDNGFGSFVDSLVGLEQHSIVELSQDQVLSNGKTARVPKVVEIQTVDRLRQSITWQESLLDGTHPFFADLPIRLDTVEFDVKLEFENKQIEFFQWLSPHPLHSLSLHTVLARDSQWVNLAFIGEPDCHWFDSACWPKPVDKAQLTSGKDGLSEIDSTHYLTAISTLSKVSEIAIVSAPDLVLGTDIASIPSSILTPKPIDCIELIPPKLGRIVGRVTNGEQPLANVLVVDAQTGKLVKSDIKGEFTIADLDISLRTLRFEKSGFNNEERQVFSSTSNDVAEFTMEPLAEPRSLTELEILEVQRAMLNPSLLGRYRVALLDPPKHLLKIEQIRNWRAKVGDSDIGALLYPWLSAPHPTSTTEASVELPPSGHIAGVMARMDLAQGPHRAAANIKLRYAKGVTQNLNDIHLGILNPEGINAIRSASGQGLRLFSARTLSSDAQWRYLPVRRLILALSKTLETALQWVVFESNTTVLRQAVTLSVQTLLNRLWRAGALSGGTADEAYRIKCDEDNNPQSSRDQGKFLLEIAVAPSVPFEFIRIRFGRTLDALEVTD